jgi:hypothetical protein
MTAVTIVCFLTDFLSPRRLTKLTATQKLIPHTLQYIFRRCIALP